jgi:L-seryl-tRNA(Ser) seleniumtransferase
MPDLRSIPPVNSLLESEKAKELTEEFGREQVLNAIRQTLDEIREQENPESISEQFIFNEVEQKLDKWFQPTLKPVINATGVILHTNLGRAPLSLKARQAVQEVAENYSTLEFNLENGKRGSRSIHIEDQLKRLLGVESALVVNNNAAAVLLCLSALARRRKVVISRTQLVEIGGGFRVPDVMHQSGAIIHEIGTTNRVHVEDYLEALQEKPALILRAHHSNYQIIGFHSEPPLKEIVEIAHSNNIPIMDDLGSGAILDTSRYGLGHEPMIQESLDAGVDVVCFSGDKLLGGPQAGIIVGRKIYLDKIKKHALARAVRADKLCLAALSATITDYLRGDAEKAIPIWQMLSKNEKELKEIVSNWKDTLGLGEIIPGKSTVGGGSLPEETVPTWLLAIPISKPDKYLAALREGDHPVIARIENDTIVFDPRTIMNFQEADLLSKIRSVFTARDKKQGKE